MYGFFLEFGVGEDIGFVVVEELLVFEEVKY